MIASAYEMPLEEVIVDNADVVLAARFLGATDLPVESDGRERMAGSVGSLDGAPLSGTASPLVWMPARSSSPSQQIAHTPSGR